MAAGPPTAIMRSSPVRAPIIGKVDCTSAKREGQHEREMTGFDHYLLSCQTPLAFRLSATSFGM